MIFNKIRTFNREYPDMLILYIILSSIGASAQ